VVRVLRLVTCAVALLGSLALALLIAAAPARGVPTWGWPLPGDPAVTRTFQPPASAWGAGHRGVDLDGEVGEPVLAAGAGTVTYAGVLAGRGVVTVTHPGGLRTTYEPVRAAVSVGQHVGLRDVLGTLGTGHASCRTGSVCLHWGLLRGSTYLDPLALVVGGRLRLLPLTASPPSADDRHRSRSRGRQKEPDERPHARPRGESLGSRLGRGFRRVARGTGRAAARAGRVAGRAVVAAGRVVGRAGARIGVRAAPYAIRAAPYAVDAVPYVAVGVIVVGGTAWYLRRRR
jgi:hypothetical protein